ncbi:MAG: flagellar filament capping protein FliD, partial [Burkholderiaceae bacterium]
LGVAASIVSDGSGTPYRLVLASNKSGASSTMKISVSGDGVAAPDATLASLLAYDPAGTQNLSQTSAAQNALLDVNGIAVSSASGSVSGAIQGVTLDLNQLGSTNVTIAKDSGAVKDSVNAFVKAYNDLNNTIKGLTSYDPTTRRAGVLLGDSTVRAIQSQLSQQLGTAVTGAAGKLTTLNQAGISRDKNGNLSVDSTKLQKALSENFSDIAGLFAAIGTASDARVAFNGSTAATKPGVYDVNITQRATRGSLTSSPLPPSTVIAPNTIWSVTLNQTETYSSSKVQRVAIPAGTYNNTELSSMLRAAINGNAAFAGAGDSVDTEISGGVLSISSSRYGTASNIAIDSISGTLVADLFGSASPVVGVNVAGTIDGIAATGSGRTLTASSGPAEGLTLTVDSELLGAHGTVSFSQGYAHQLNNLAAGFLGKDGVISNKSDGLNVTSKAVSKSRDAFNERLAATEKRYRAQFTALDMMLTSMQSTSTYLSQQLNALANNT